MITMDDLDHSMRISDHDWLSFFEESEEGCRLKPSLACPDSSGLSDGDDADCTTCTFIPLNGLVQQAEKDHKNPIVVEDVLSVVCSAEETSKVEPVGNNAKLEPEPLVMKYALSCSEKERWFVTVNDSPSQSPKTVAGPVVKKKRKQKKIYKEKHKDGKSHACTTDMIMQLKGPEKLFLVKNKTSQMLCKGDNSQVKLRGGSCDDINQLLSPGTEAIQELSRELHSIRQSKELDCLEASNKDDTLHFSMEDKRGQRTKLNCDAGSTENSDTVFLQEKDTDLGDESSPTQLTVDLTCIEDSRLEDIMDTCKSTKTCFALDIQKQAHFEGVQEDDENQRGLKELNVDVKCVAKNRLYQSAKGNFRNSDLRATLKNVGDEEMGNERNKQEDLGYIGVSSKVNLFDLEGENNVEHRLNPVKPTNNPVPHSNSIESDEFADVEFFSSSSHDSEAYHSAAESIDNPLHLPIQNSPCHLPININDDSLADRGMDSTLQRESRPSRIETSQIFPSAHPGADNVPNDNTACNEGTEGTVPSMSVDTPTSAGNSSNSLAPGSLHQFDMAMESPEAYAKANGNYQPVYAISAFWDEMEKLTINDILQIRTGRCMLPVEESFNTYDLVSTSCDGKNPTSMKPETESSVLDTMDAADSDYYTNLDESKPDRSSCDFSTSDFEEEYWQFINSSRTSSPDQHDKNYKRQCIDYVSAGEEESDEMGTPVPPENGSGKNWSDLDSYDVIEPHRMRKTKSMYDVHAVKATDDLSSQTFLDQSSCKSREESLNMSDGFEVVNPIMCHADEQYQISFPKVFENLLDDDKAKCDALSVSVYSLLGSSILPYQPINNYTFCTTIMDFLPKLYSVEPIPIFSCSRPSVRELTFLKQGGIFLGAKYSAMKDVSPIQIISQSIIKSMDCKKTDRAFCFSQDLSSLYSVKNICFLDKGSDVWRYACEEKEKPEDAIDSSFTVVGEGGLFSLTPQMFKETTLRQISMDNQMSSDQGIFSTLKQSDMCLVCIAFASWVLKSSDPEAADAWKAALLANVSALSAIQYLRQYMKKKAAPQDD